MDEVFNELQTAIEKARREAQEKVQRLILAFSEPPPPQQPQPAKSKEDLVALIKTFQSLSWANTQE